MVVGLAVDSERKRPRTASNITLPGKTPLLSHPLSAALRRGSWTAGSGPPSKRPPLRSELRELTGALGLSSAAPHKSSSRLVPVFRGDTPDFRLASPTFARVSSTNCCYYLRAPCSPFNFRHATVDTGLLTIAGGNTADISC